MVGQTTRYRLGAEELIELGQPVSTTAVAAPGAFRTVTVSRQEGELLVRVVEAIVEFAKGFPLEFHSYCPVNRWQAILKSAGTGTASIERQLASGAKGITLSADTLFSIMDLEECVSGARDARLSSAKLALMVSAAGAAGEVLFGLSWLGLPAYIISLAIVLGRPLAALAKEPAEPFKVDVALQGACHEEKLGDHTDKAKVIERVIVAPDRGPERHHWGEVFPAPGTQEGAVCLTQGKFRVRVEGWKGDRVVPVAGWSFASLSECREARHEIAVWGRCDQAPRSTRFGEIPASSGHDETFWVDYTGPLTGDRCRRAGPFG